MKRIALIGECMIELNGAPFGTMMQTFGGDSLNSAIYLARASQGKVKVQYVSALGHDPLSQGMLTRWQQEGIDTQLVLQDETRQPGLYLIQLDEQGERTFMYWRNQSAARYLLQHPEFFKVAQSLEQCDMIYLSGISLAILPDADKEALIVLLTTLSQQGCEIVFDTNYRPKLWSSPEQAKACYQQVLAITHLALVTDDDEQHLWGDLDASASLSRLKQAGVSKAVVKMGAKGCIYQDLSQVSSPELIPTIPVSHVVDTTSAGDAFNAGFLSGYLQAQAPKTCALMGHALAGCVIQHKGAIIPKASTDSVISQFGLLMR
ncbi:MAG: sugar kinase [Thiotrichaceae bacterium]